MIWDAGTYGLGGRDPCLDYSVLTGRTLKQIERGKPKKVLTNAHAIV